MKMLQQMSLAVVASPDLDRDLVVERLLVRNPPCLSRPADGGGRYAVVFLDIQGCSSGNRCSWRGPDDHVVVEVGTLDSQILVVQ